MSNESDKQPHFVTCHFMKLKNLIALAAIAGSLGLAGCKPKQTTIPRESEAHQRDVANAESQVQTCQINITNAAQNIEEAQTQFDRAKAGYDQFMATQPLLTNAVYLRFKKDLAFRAGLIPGKQQTISFAEGRLQNANALLEAKKQSLLPGPGHNPHADQTWVQDASNHRVGSGHWSGGNSLEDLNAQVQAAAKILADYTNDLANTYAQIHADQQTLEKLKADTSAFQTGKLHDAETLLNAAKTRLTDAQSSLAAAKSHLETIKN